MNRRCLAGIAISRNRRPLIRSATHPTRSPRERAILVGVEIKDERRTWALADSLDELGQLAETAGAEVLDSIAQTLAKPNPAHYLGPGKLEELQARRLESGADLVIFDDELSPTQQRNLEEALGVKVLDRTALILDIFARRAQTREGRLQVELAQHEYLLPRLAGQWSHLERLGAGIGTRGPGEAQIETDRRLIRNKISHLKHELEGVRRHRALHRQQRQKQGVPIVALVGYTNAGKSTLLNVLTGASVQTEDKLFATLDPTTRRLTLPRGREALLTDTVGFIQKLPTTLVAAFRATLEELAEADLLLHVLDITHPNAAEQSAAVAGVLASLGLDRRPRLLVLNKVDRLAPGELGVAGQAAAFEAVRANLGPVQGVLVSAVRGWGLPELREAIEDALEADLVEVTVRLPYGAEALASVFRREGTILDERFSPQGHFMRGLLPRRLVAQFAPFSTDRTTDLPRAAP